MPSDRSKFMTARSPIPDCPKWAADLLAKLHRLEVKLGNIIEATPAKDSTKDSAGDSTGEDSSDGTMAWHTRDLGDLIPDDRDENESGGDADLAEAIFDRVCAGLAEDGFTAQEIADIVNSRVGNGGRMKYCDASDVNEALEA
ncbi:hypothetical protein EBZ80_11730 [bacterium]|nr:hypothetical protein [bacterium]